MHILLIEPDTLLGSAYVRAAAADGHSIDHATSSQHAVTLADNTRPHIVVMELQLPGQNGIAFLQEFRSYSEWAHVPVIFHTYVMPHGRGDVKEILHREYGVVDWLYKPSTTLQQLLQSIQHHGQRNGA